MKERTPDEAEPSIAATVRLVAIRDSPVEVAEVLAAVADHRAGGVVSFTGLVRADDAGRQVHALEYQAHPDALRRLEEVAEAVAVRFPVVALAAVHRTGLLSIGEVAVVVAASAAHRAAAFDAAQALIDDLKAQVPIWKRQSFTDGAHEWVGSP